MEYKVDISLHDAMSLLELGEDFHDEVQEVLTEFCNTASPEGGYKIYETLSMNDSGFILENTEFCCGKKILKALQGSEQMAVVLATVGEDVESLIKKYNDEYDFLKAYWCDKLSNWTLDRIIESIKGEISSKCAENQFKITSNWGPGYCGWDVSEQKKLLPLSVADKLNISLSSSMLMHPIKSISGVIGIGKNVAYKKSGCGDCNLVKCAYRSLKW